jgi:hypothetical protein
MFNQSHGHDVACADRASDAFVGIADDLSRESDVQGGTGFSTDPGLRSSGKLFAILRGGELVVRLSARDADELVRTRGASRFWGSENARLAQWVALPYSVTDGWIRPAQVALAYARDAA